MAVKWTCDRCGEAAVASQLKRDYNKLADLCSQCWQDFHVYLSMWIKGEA